MGGGRAARPPLGTTAARTGRRRPRAAAVAGCVALRLDRAGAAAFWNNAAARRLSPRAAAGARRVHRRRWRRLRRRERRHVGRQTRIGSARRPPGARPRDPLAGRGARPRELQFRLPRRPAARQGARRRKGGGCAADFSHRGGRVRAARFRIIRSPPAPRIQPWPRLIAPGAPPPSSLPIAQGARRPPSARCRTHELKMYHACDGSAAGGALG